MIPAGAPIPINIAVEDYLSDILIRRIFGFVQRFAVGLTYTRGGYGYVRTRVGGWNQAAKGRPFVVLTDLDQAACPAALIQDWLPGGVHPNLVFRVAVREAESWVLADSRGFAGFLGVRVTAIPEEPDALIDPKMELVRLAATCRNREIRESLVPRRGSTARVGPAYNAVLGGFVAREWNVERARQRSPSLARAVKRLAAFHPVWGAEN